MTAGQKAVESTAKEKQVQVSALTDHADHASEAETSPTIMKEEVSETTGLAEDSLTMVREGILTVTDHAEISPKTEREEGSVREEGSTATDLEEISLKTERERVSAATDLAGISLKTEREEVSEEIQQRKASTERISTISGMKRKAESTR